MTHAKYLSSQRLKGKGSLKKKTESFKLSQAIGGAKKNAINPCARIKVVVTGTGL